MQEQTSRLEMWGGVECTVNRVGDRFHDQLRRNGHLERPDDLDRFAALGITTLRVPVLWELSEQEPGRYQLERFDPMLERARALGLCVVAGLVHHGSGPMRTQLLDPQFEHGLADFAAEVSKRYPWIEHYTPINEPLTTARFAALYGHWYPHARSPESFLRALLHETRATVRAMQSIRRNVPGARLLQTEDVGSISSTPLLAYQAEHENLRRWLSLDLLTGKVTPDHPLHAYLRDVGRISSEELAWLVEHACPPDLIGVNYYFTSDRHLDERLERYPAWAHGGNGRHAYADVHGTMVPELGLRGHRKVLQEVWERYRVPMVISEVHAGNAREEQLRWLEEAWQAAEAARAEQVDVRAVTAWSLLGSFDWGSLVTSEQGIYEPGVFDLRAPTPRPTALASMVRALANKQAYDHPVLDNPGWWRRKCTRPWPLRRRAPARPVAIVGARGTLGRALIAACRERGIAFEALDRKRLDLGRADAIEQTLNALRPWAVINAAGYVRVDEAERDEAACLQTNVGGAVSLARACHRTGSALLTFSSDLVFGGQQQTPYLESDSTSPLCAYGRSKLAAEQQVSELLRESLIVRTSAFFGADDEANFVTHTLHLLARGEHVRAAFDVTISPTYVPHLADACLDLLIDGETGIYHLANQGALSWFELAQRAARALGFDERRVQPCRIRELNLPAKRPKYSALGSERSALMQTLDQGLSAYIERVGNRFRA